MLRSHQPYQNPRTRPQTLALMAMLKGAPAHGNNPMDLWRLAQHRMSLLRFLR
jgi:hypothetical protein